MLLQRVFHLFAVGLMSLVILSMTGCASRCFKNPVPTDLTKYYRAVVHAGDSDEGQERLKKYNSRLKILAGVSDLEVNWIGCIHCTDVENGTKWKELIYIFYREHQRSQLLLGGAYAEVYVDTMTQSWLDEFTIKVDSEPLDATACPASPPAPSGCTNVPSCITTASCDRYFPSPTGCQKCAY